MFKWEDFETTAQEYIAIRLDEMCDDAIESAKEAIEPAVSNVPMASMLDDFRVLSEKIYGEGYACADFNSDATYSDGFHIGFDDGWETLRDLVLECIDKCKADTVNQVVELLNMNADQLREQIAKYGISVGDILSYDAEEFVVTTVNLGCDVVGGVNKFGEPVRYPRDEYLIKTGRRNEEIAEMFMTK